MLDFLRYKLIYYGKYDELGSFYYCVFVKKYVPLQINFFVVAQLLYYYNVYYKLIRIEEKYSIDMFTLYKKELGSFFSSLMGYLTIIVFLLLNGLMLWVFNSDFNIMDYGYAGLDGLFLIGPFLFLFLIPAITMRMFSEEKKNGTIELLFTKPLSEYHIIFAKLLAGITLVFISILPQSAL